MIPRLSGLVLFVGLLCIANSLNAAAGEIRSIVSHNQVKVVTDPSQGSNPYPRWTEFPSRDVDYRKVILYVTYQCPDGQHCGEWDYIDGVYLRRIGGEAQPRHDIELARLISPYGSRFDSTWSFSWHVDVTDFAALLHDSVEVEFLHTGYESNADRGWVVTLDFIITEGKPAQHCLGFDSLWSGSIPFGDSTRPIENIISARSFTAPDSAVTARLRIMQTGHGMDDLENCAEFCSKYRRVIYDDSLFSQRQLWRQCGDSPLYPQAGTWIFDRANWCPGSMVAPDVYDLPVSPGSTHKIDIDMEPYLNSSKPTANYFLYSYLFYYAQPWAANDASIAEILIPSGLDEFSRLNPACANPVIVIKNNGREILRSLEIGYGHGMPPQHTFHWTGSLASQAVDTVQLPGPIAPKEENKFLVQLDHPNGVADEYPEDNTEYSSVPVTDVYGTTMLLAIHTNADSSQTGYAITDTDGKVVYTRPGGSMQVNTTYLDTLRLAPGCYELVVSDTARDGLDFWFNPEGGYGYARLLDIAGRLIKAFPSDFGTGIRHWFRTVEGRVAELDTVSLPIINPFPARSKGVFSIDVFLNRPAELRLRIIDESGVETILDNLYAAVKAAMIPIDISSAPDGVYYIKATVEGKTVTRRIRIKRTD